MQRLATRMAALAPGTIGRRARHWPLHCSATASGVDGAIAMGAVFVLAALLGWFGLEYLWGRRNAMPEIPEKNQLRRSIRRSRRCSPKRASHRITFGGQDTEEMHGIGSFLMTSAPLPLGLSIGANAYVAVVKISDSAAVAAALAAALCIVLFGLWYAMPFMRRRAVPGT